MTENLMPQFRLGVDVDGVLADFNVGFHRLLEERTNRGIPYQEPTVWAWPTAWGYTREEESAAWEWVKHNEFWALLQPMPELALTPAVSVLLGLAVNGHPVYFMTNRPGNGAWHETIYWLVKHGFPKPMVMITPELETKFKNEVIGKEPSKGYIAKGLDLTHFIDDKPGNCVDVKQKSPKTRVFIITRGWNDTFDEKPHGIERVDNLHAFFTALMDEQTAIGEQIRKEKASALIG